MAIVDKPVQEEKTDWDDFQRRLHEPPADGHQRLVCRWVPDPMGDGRMISVWVPADQAG